MELRTSPSGTVSFGIATKCAMSFLEESPVYQHEKPYSFEGPLPPSEEHRRSNIRYTTVKDIPMRNLRGFERDFNLKRHGFQFFKTDLGLVGEKNIDEYLIKMTNFLKRELQAETVLCYDYRFRKSKSVGERNKDIVNGLSPDNPGNPAFAAHVDQTRDGGLRRVKRHLTAAETEKYLDGNWRVRIVNIWRPLEQMVEDAPLALCDFYTLGEDDLVPADRASPSYVGEIYYLKPNDNQCWYWLRHQKHDELTMLLSYDSDPGEGPAFCPHASFQDPTASIFAPPRESIEVRAIVITPRTQNGIIQKLWNMLPAIPTPTDSMMEVNLTHLVDSPLWDTVKPYEITLPDLPPGLPRTNCEFVQYQVHLRDARMFKKELDFDKSGFKFIQHVCQAVPTIYEMGDESTDLQILIAPYLREVIKLAQNETGAEKVIAVDWRYRNNVRNSSRELYRESVVSRHLARKPFLCVHSDYSIQSGNDRIKAFLNKEELEEYNQGYWRIRLLNIWRPLVATIEDSPLAFCDRRSVKLLDLVPYDKILVDRNAENCFVKHRSTHRWYWQPCQTKDQPAIFVVWDSLDLKKESGCPGFVPHSAFNNPNAGIDALPRQSIEVQVMVMTASK